jgi:hypothetical protein
MNLNPIAAAGKRLAKWLLPHILDEVQKEVERKTAPNDPNTGPSATPPTLGGQR